MADLPRIGLICSCQTETHPARRSAIQLQVKTILNCVQRFVGFVYQEVRLHCAQEQPESIEITDRAAWRHTRALFALPAAGAGL